MNANSHVHDEPGELLESIEIEAGRLADLRKAERHARAQLAALEHDLASARAPRPSSKERWTFALCAAVLLPIMVWSSIQFGTTWDEPDRHLNGEHVRQFLTGQADRTSFGDDHGAPYGGLFDLICVLLLGWVPLERSLLRHAVNAVFGWIGIVYCGRLASRLFGPWSGLLAVILLSTSPRYLADSMNNPKDLPFAAATIVALYYLSTIHPRWPYLAPWTTVKIAVVLALALNIRAGALLYLAYFGLLVVTFVIRERNWNRRRLRDTAGRLAGVTVATLLLGTLLWPWAGAAALQRLVLAVFSFPESSDGPRVLYAGQWLYATAIPRTYAPWWILISTPPVVLGGLAAALTFGLPNGGRPARRRALWVVALLPVALVVMTRSALYDGIRHLLFVYPVLVVLSASGWIAWLSQVRPWLRRSAVVLLIAGVIHILVFVFRFHPHETIYFNELVGGPRGAFARYDMDYWGNCLQEAVAWSAEAARLSHMPIAIGASHEPRPSLRWETERFAGVLWAPDHNYIDIRLNRGSATEVEKTATADALYRVTSADGVVLCVVQPGPQFDELKPRLTMPDKTFPRTARWR